MEGKELRVKVIARHQIGGHVYEYPHYFYGFASEEINRNKEAFITTQERMTDLIRELALLNERSREKNSPRRWIINAPKEKVKGK